MSSSYGEFYGMLNALPYDGDREELKQMLVEGISLGRTTHVSELSTTEYKALCLNMRNLVKISEKEAYASLRRKRRAVLLLMARYGLETQDWTAIDNFCLQKCIAGKKFKELTAHELDQLNRKMRSILNKQTL